MSSARVAVRLSARCLWSAVLATLLTACGPQLSATRAPADPALPSVRPAAPDPRVGAVFVGDVHICSAAVLDSPAGDLILTAAHCLTADTDAEFVPGFGAGDSAADGWQVDAVFFDPRWIDGYDPAADFAVARVSRADGARLQSAAGAGLRLGSAPEVGEEVTVLGYPAGIGGGPTACRAPAAPQRHGFPSLRCDGVVAGFSGAPWISGSTVTGVIGGLDGGGCAEEVSYSPPFGAAVSALVARAEAGGPGDDAPASFDDGCG
ncbi:Trypsin [Mycobacterium sp. smrl_JER01]